MGGRLRDYVARVATGPRLSKDLTADEARDAVGLVLAGDADPVQAGVLLVALRMKRETFDENLGALRAVRDAVRTARADVADVVELADPHDGFARTLPASPFLGPVLAACGVAAVAHGCDELPPKRGLSTRRVLAAAGVDVDLTVAAAARRIADPRVGWAYVDVAQCCPPLHALAELRDAIVKRPVLATVEKLLGPVRGRRTHLIVGYVHHGYETLLADLARAVGYDSALVVKGLEGGVIPSLTARSTALGYRGDGPAASIELDPAAIGIAAAERAVDRAPDATNAAAARAAARLGLAALEGAHGPTRDALIHAAAHILAHIGAAPTLADAATRARAALDSGQARTRL